MVAPAADRDLGRRAMFYEQIGGHRQHIVALELALNMDRQALPAVLLDHGDHPERQAVVRTISHEVVAPHMAAIVGPQPHVRSVIQPEPAVLRQAAHRVRGQDRIRGACPCAASVAPTPASRWAERRGRARAHRNDDRVLHF